MQRLQSVGRRSRVDGIKIGDKLIQEKERGSGMVGKVQKVKKNEVNENVLKCINLECGGKQLTDG